MAIDRYRKNLHNRADPATLTVTTGVSLVTANVKDSTGAVVNGVSVTFTRTGGGAVVAGPLMTNGVGNAVTTYSAGAAGSCVVTASSAAIGGVTYTGAATITVP